MWARGAFILLVLACDGPLPGPDAGPGEDAWTPPPGLDAGLRTTTLRTDLDADGRCDLVYQHVASGAVAVWLMDGVTRTSGNLTTPRAPEQGIGQRLATTCDLDGDADTDLVFQDALTGGVAIWTMDGITRVGLPSEPLFAVDTSPATWRLATSGDFDQDGDLDLVLQNVLSGAVSVWLMDGLSRTSSTLTEPPIPEDGLAWRLVTSGDFDLDGRSDLVFQDGATGNLMFWLMNGTTRIADARADGAMGGPGWRVATSCDFDADADSDLVFQNSNSGNTVVWFMSRTVHEGGAVTDPPQPACPTGQTCTRVLWTLSGG